MHFDDLALLFRYGSVVALLYFQFANDWLVTAWAAVIFVLFGLALLLNRSMFLHQGILLTVGTCAAASCTIFSAQVISAAATGPEDISCLVRLWPFYWHACHLLFGCAMRRKQQTLKIRWLGALVRHPEQFMFFAPVLLLTLDARAEDARWHGDSRMGH